MEKSENMFSQSRKLIDEVENETSSFSRRGLSLELSRDGFRPAVQTNRNSRSQSHQIYRTLISNLGVGS